MTDGDHWSVKQHYWKSEAKEDHQLSPGGPSNRQKLWSKPTKMRKNEKELGHLVMVSEQMLQMYFKILVSVYMAAYQ